MKNFDGSPSPNQMIASGIHARGGIGRRSSISGRAMRPNHRYQPARTPTITPAKTPIFEEARERLRDRIDHWGYATSAAEYARWLWRADLLPVTSRQDFFGISVVEAIHCNCLPLLPQRLAYPEHVPPKRFPECFYETEEELYAKLKKNLQHPATLRQLSPLRELVSRYDWRNLASVYDDLFMRLWMQKG